MAVAQAAPVVAAAAAHTVYLPAACRGISSRGTTGMFRWRPRRRALARARPARRGSRATGRGRGLVVVAEFGGTYEDGFEDVHKNIINYFTYKATHTVLHQLYEMNPPAYTWLYSYISVNDPLDGDYFLRLLAKEKRPRRESDDHAPPPIRQMDQAMRPRDDVRADLQREPGYHAPKVGRDSGLADR